jgi:hypothetical protein
MEIPQYVAFLVAWFGIGSLVWVLFARAETVLNPQVIDNLKRWLKNESKEINRNWPSTFSDIFDQIFGTDRISWKRFFRSSLVSLSVVIILFFLFFATETIDAGRFLNGRYAWIGFILTILFFNLPIDFIGQLKTREFLNYLPNKTFSVQVRYLLLDIFLTLLIFFIFYYFTMMPEFRPHMGYSWTENLTNPDYYKFHIRTFKVYLGFERTYLVTLDHYYSDPVKTLVIYSTFFTSVWVTLFVISGVFIKGINKFLSVTHIFGKWFNIEEAPLRSMGFVIMLFVTIAMSIAYWL